MTPILTGIIASGISGHLTPPWSPDGAYDALGVVTLSTSTASVTFAGIPNGYRHLQIRYTAMTTRATYGYDAMTFRVNDDSSSNYSWHVLRGAGVSTSSGGGGGDNQWYMDWGFGTTVSSYPSSGIIDISDYANTAKAKSMHGIYGEDLNGTIAGLAGSVNIISGAWHKSGYPPINQISFASYNGNNIAANSKFALYGVK